MPDIVSSTTPEPTKVEENVVQQDVAQKTIKTENADAAAESGDNDSAESDIDKDLRGFAKVESAFRLILPIASVDGNGNTFDLTDFIDDEDDEIELAKKCQLLMHPGVSVVKLCFSSSSLR